MATRYCIGETPPGSPVVEQLPSPVVRAATEKADGCRSYCIESPPMSPMEQAAPSLTPRPRMMSVVQTPGMLGLSSMYLLNKGKEQVPLTPLSPYLPSFIRTQPQVTRMKRREQKTEAKAVEDMTDDEFLQTDPADCIDSLPGVSSPAGAEGAASSPAPSTPTKSLLSVPKSFSDSPGRCDTPPSLCRSPICEGTTKAHTEDVHDIGCDDDEVDEFGFLIEMSKLNNIDNTSGGMMRHPEAEEQLIGQWRKLMEDGEMQEEGGAAPSSNAFKLRVGNMVKSGIPNSIRGEVWAYLAGSSIPSKPAPWAGDKTGETTREKTAPLLQLNLHTSSSSSASDPTVTYSRAVEALRGDGTSEAERMYDELVNRGDNEHTDQIKLDIYRTFTTHSMFRVRGGAGQQKLQRLLQAFSHHNGEIGYCQGMSYVAAMLLLHVEKEAQAFWMLDWMLDTERVGEYYIRTMSGVIRDSGVFEELLKTHYPLLNEHLQAANVHSLMYITPWFMALFTHLSSWRTVLRIMDLFFFEGTMAIFRSSLAIMHSCQEELLSLNGLDELLPFLQNIPHRHCKEEALLPVACALPIAHYYPHAKENARKAAVKQAAEKEARTKALAMAREKREMEKKREALRQQQQANASNSSLFDRFLTSITPRSRRQSSRPVSAKRPTTRATNVGTTPTNARPRQGLRMRSASTTNRSMSVMDARMTPGKKSPRKRARQATISDAKLILIQSPPKKAKTNDNIPKVAEAPKKMSPRERRAAARAARQRRSTTATGRDVVLGSPASRRRRACDSPLKNCTASSPATARRRAAAAATTPRPVPTGLLSPSMKQLRETNSPSKLNSPLSPFSKRGMMDMKSLSPSKQGGASCRRSLRFRSGSPSSPRSPTVDMR